MNAIRPVLQLPPPVDPNPVASATPSTHNSSDNQGFSSAMQSAGSKPTRKAPAHRNGDSSGGNLPPNGNHSPSPAATPPSSANQAAPATAGPRQTDNSSTKAAAVQAQSAASATTPAATSAPAAGADRAAVSAEQTPPAEDAAAAAAAKAAAEALAALTATPEATATALPLATAPDPATSAAADGQTLPDAAAALSGPGNATSAPPAPTAEPKAPLSTATNVHIAAQGGAAAGKAVGVESPRLQGGNQDANTMPSNADATASRGDATVGVSALSVLTTVAAQGSDAPPQNAVPDATVQKAPFTATGANKPLDQTLDMTAAQNPDQRPATAAASAGTAQMVMNVIESNAADRRTHSDSSDLAASGSVDAAGLVQQNNSAPALQNAVAPQFKVAANVDSSEFGQGVAQQVTVMVDNGLNTAKLQVNPASLGPIEVRIAIQGDHAQVSMASHSAVTRDALEQSSPKLKEALSAQGFAQVSVDISHRSFQERTPTPPSYEWNAGQDNSVSPAPVMGASMRTQNGLLDAYA